MPFLVEKARTGYSDLIEFYSAANTPAVSQLLEGCEQSIQTLTDPDLVWVDSDMCELVETSGEVPPWSPESCIPSPHGFMGLEKPFFTVPSVDVDTGKYFDVPVSGLAWEAHGDSVRVTAWVQRAHMPDASTEFQSVNLFIAEVMGVTLKLGDLIDGVPEFYGVNDKRYRVAARAIQDAVGAFWLVMTQPAIVEERQSQPVKVRKVRGGVARKSPVRVSVRSLVKRVPSGSAGGTGTGRKATTRWWVRGHWRQQAWGKGRKLRKPVFIQPHTAGAQGADVDSRPSVQVWRTGQESE